MAYTRTVLRDGARALADQNDADFPTDTQYNAWLDLAKRRVWFDLLTSGWPVNYTTQTISATGAAGIQHALSGTVASVQAVYRTDTGSRIPVPRVDEQSRQTSASSGLETSYELRVDPTTGTVVRFFPPVAGTFEVEYITEPSAFSGDSDTWNGPARSDELIMLRAAALGCRKEGRRGDAQDLLADYAEVLQAVKDTASWVDQRNAPKIRDVMGSERRFDEFDYPIGGGSY